MVVHVSADTEGTLKGLDSLKEYLNKGMQERLDAAGALLQAKMEEKIDGWMKPTNHPFTVEQKESSQPLIDTGEMHGQIDHRTGPNYVEVGVFGSRAGIAKIHEFGKEIDVTERMRKYLHRQGLHLSSNTTKITIPERSFMRSAHSENRRLIKKIVTGKR